MSETPPRYCQEQPLPPYSYVTGLSPHPTRDERGHSFGRHEPPPAPLDNETYRTNPAYLYGLDLFNHGFYWEAHEAWEALWHAAGRRGPAADFLKGLIKLAAAGVKAREGRAAGVRQHAERSKELVASAAAGQTMFGLNTAELIAQAGVLAAQAEELAGDGRPDARRRLPLMLELTPQ
jgi:predicted metal-dependent hydrolase